MPLCFCALLENIPQNPARSQRWNTPPVSTVATNAHHLTPSLLEGGPGAEWVGLQLCFFTETAKEPAPQTEGGWEMDRQMGGWVGGCVEALHDLQNTSAALSENPVRETSQKPRAGVLPS